MLEDLRHHALEHVANFLLGEEAGFNINLCEFRLTICTQIFITEAFGDLVIAVIAGHHQQLFEKLGRLRQREELAIVHTARHQIIACPFGCALGEHRCLDVDETRSIQIIAHRHRHFVTQHQIILHVRAAQIQDAMRQARGLREIVVIELERWRDRCIEHGELVAKNFNLAALDVVIRCASRASTHQAFDLQTKLVAHTFSHFERLSAIRIAHDLHSAFAIAQINKNHTAMIAPAIDPTAERNDLAEMRFGHKTRITRAH